MNLYDYAMQMENDAESLYKKLADKARTEGVRKIFRDLAADEHRHFQTLKALQAGKQASVGECALLDDAKNLFARLLERKATLETAEDDLEAYHHAMKLESQAAGHYREMLAREENPANRKLLEKIIAQEFDHFQIVENLFHFVDAPNQYLAWREFSNLEEFYQFGRDVDL